MRYRVPLQPNTLTASPPPSPRRPLLRAVAALLCGLVAPWLATAQTPSAPAPRSETPPASVPSSLSLAQALELALARDPALQAAAWEAESAEARARQARLWPNPELELERENVGGSGAFAGTDNAEDTLSISQLLPLNGQRRARQRLALAKQEQADWDYHHARLQTLLSTTRRFLHAAEAQRRLALAEQELELARAIEAITAKRVDAGDASPVALARVTVPVVSAELAVTKAQLARDAAWRRLSLSWGDRSARFDALDADLDRLKPLPDPDAWVERINQSPELARWAAEIGARDAERQVARRQAIPNPNLRLGLKRDRGSDSEGLVLGLSLPVPLFDRNQGETAAARAALRSAEQRQRAAELTLESALSARFLELATARAEADALQGRALPAAEAAFQATRQAYAAGELPYLDVLDAQRALFDLQHRYLDALVAHHLAAAELEALLGGPLQP